MPLNRINRRDFMRRGAGAAAIGLSGKVAILEPATLWDEETQRIKG